MPGSSSATSKVDSCPAPERALAELISLTKALGAATSLDGYGFAKSPTPGRAARRLGSCSPSDRFGRRLGHRSTKRQISPPVHRCRRGDELDDRKYAFRMHEPDRERSI